VAYGESAGVLRLPHGHGPRGLPGAPEHAEYFPLEYLSGSYMGISNAMATTNHFPEGTTTTLLFNDTLWIGSPQSLDLFGDRSIDTWRSMSQPGAMLGTRNGFDFLNQLVAPLSITYWSTEPFPADFPTPPAPVPLPAGFWLLISGGGLLAWLRSRSNAAAAAA